MRLVYTRDGSEAEKLREAPGYVRFGKVPGYGRSGGGELHAAVYLAVAVRNDP